MKQTVAPMRKSLTVVTALMTALVALQCIEPPLEPVAPSWQTQLSIPLTDITRFLSDATRDSSVIMADPSGVLLFEDTQSGQPVTIDTLKVSPQPSQEQVSIGIVEISALPTTTAGVTATDLGMPSGTWPGPPAPAFPGSTTTLPAVAVGDTTQFAFAVIDTGSLTMTITNTLPMAITFNGALVLKNNVSSDTTAIASFSFGTIASGAAVTRSASLAGKLVWGMLRTAPVGVTIASKTGPFDINASTGLQFSFGSSPLRVLSARAVVPPQQVVSFNDSVIVVDDSVSVQSAFFRSGVFSTRIVNNLDVEVGVRLKFGNFRSTITGDTMSILRAVAPRSVAVFPFSLDTIQLVNPVPDPLGTRVRFSVGIETITSAGQKSTIASGDFVRAEFTPQNNFVLRNITGRIKPTTLAFASGARGLNMGDAGSNFSVDSIKFDDVKIAVRLGMTGGYPIQYSLALEARNRKTNTKASLQLPPPEGSTDTVFTPVPGSMTTISLGNAQGLSAFLSTFFPNFPDTFIVRGSVVINPNFVQATIHDTSKLYQAVNVYFPLKIGLSGARIEDKISLENSEFPTEFVNDVKQASLRFSVTNRIPAQVAFRLELQGPVGSGTGRGTLLRIPTDGTSRTVAAATVDVNGNAVTPATSHFDIALNSLEVSQFNAADTMYYRIDLETSGSGTQAVRFRTSDYIRLRMSGNLVYIVNNPN